MKSTNPALNANPAVQWKNAATAKDKPVNAACTTYKAGAKNINEKSSGSVTPVKKAAKPAANMSDAVCFLRFVLAVWYMARRAAGKPNIIVGKNPARYIPVTPFVPVPAQKFPISSIPATSNQNTEFNAWCNPVGINNLLKNPYNPAPINSKLLIAVPNETSPENTIGQTKNMIAVATNIDIAVMMGTSLLPLKNARKSGN